MYKFNFLLLLTLLLSINTSCAQQVVGIIETINLPTARHECATVALGGQLYLIGGRGIKPVEVFNPTTKTWKKAGPTPFEVHHFQPVVFEDEIYVLSAFTGGYPRETPLENVWIYNPKEDLWREGPEIPENRRRGAGGVLTVGSKIYVAGGILDGHNSGTVSYTDVFDPKTGAWKELPDMPNRRDHTVAVGDSQNMYLIGGRTTDYHEEDSYNAFLDKTVSKMDRFNFSENKWETVSAELPVATAGGGAVLFNKKIYYMGGETSQVPAHNEIQVYDIASNSWTLISPLEQGRHGTHAAIIDKSILIASGSGNSGGGPELQSVEVINLD